MKRILLPVGFWILLLFGCQPDVFKPDLSAVSDPAVWTIHNRELIEADHVQVNAQEGDGFVKLNDYVFDTGTIELDIQGKDEPGRSFVGFAFHGKNDSTYDVVYFRPFNFKNPERNSHSVQYISHPKYPWRRLREEHPGMYENTLNVVPDPNDWFHVKLVIADHQVKAYIEHAEEPCLVVDQISHRHGGWLGFWVGFNSEGSFKNLVIHATEDEH